MKTLIIKSEKYGIQEILLDDEDYAWASKYTWHVNFNSNNNTIGKLYVKRKPSLKSGKKTNLRLHREIMKARKGVIVDHINGNTLDNRKTNLRISTQAENVRNRTLTRLSVPDIAIGVSKEKDRNGDSWKAEIKDGNKIYFLGYYKYKEQAAIAHDKKATELFGTKAILNFPRDQ